MSLAVIQHSNIEVAVAQMQFVASGFAKVFVEVSAIFELAARLKDINKMKICYLCKEQKPLSRKSHIIPKFMYEGMFIDNEPIYKSPVNVTEENKHLVKRLRIGLYENDILCLDCEQKHLGHYYDDYVSTIHNGTSSSYNTSIQFENLTSEIGFNYISISNIDKDRYRLFLLSILFRVSISQLDAFDEINIEDSLLEKIRKSIYSKIIDNNLNIHLNITSYRHLDLEYGQIIAKPATIYLDNGLLVYSMLINGFAYQFYVTDDLNKLSPTTKFLATDNIKILMLEKGLADKIILAHFGKKALQPT